MARVTEPKSSWCVSIGSKNTRVHSSDSPTPIVFFVDESIQKFCDRVFNAESNFDTGHQAV